MAACGSLSSLFDNPLPKKPIGPSSTTTFTELFGELHFQENPKSSSGFGALFDNKRSPSSNSSSSSSSLDSLLGGRGKDHHYSGGFSPKNNSDQSLQLCTEGLGSESSDDVDDLMNESDLNNDWKSSTDDYVKEEKGVRVMDVRSKVRGRGFPPPIPSIGRGGKPWVCFKSFREGGRFVLREIRIPTQEFLHASREDGRLKLHFVHPDSDIAEEAEEEEEEEEEEEGEEQEVGEGEVIIAGQ